MHAARNIKLCTKDCVCLFVCPTGATDTENGQIDFSKCLDGCRLCIDTCPSHALYLVPSNYAIPQQKSDDVKDALFALASSKAKQEAIVTQIQDESGDPILKQLAKAMQTSNRILVEDCLREAGYMLGQSKEAKDFLRSLLHEDDPDFPIEAVKKLLTLL